MVGVSKFYTIRKRSGITHFFDEEEEKLAVSVYEGCISGYKSRGQTLWSICCLVRHTTNSNGLVVGFAVYNAKTKTWNDDMLVGQELKEMVERAQMKRTEETRSKQMRQKKNLLAEKVRQRKRQEKPMQHKAETKETHMKNDPVNHPSHYTDGGIETIDYIENNCKTVWSMNAVKYISRAGKKSKETELQDLEKARWYIRRYMQEWETYKSGIDVDTYCQEKGLDKDLQRAVAFLCSADNVNFTPNKEEYLTQALQALERGISVRQAKSDTPETQTTNTEETRTTHRTNK